MSSGKGLGLRIDRRILLAFVIAAAFALGMLIRGGGSSGSEHEGGTGEEVAQASVWTCSMHPQIRQPGPGDCPLCGIDAELFDPGVSRSHKWRLQGCVARAADGVRRLS